MRATHQSQTGPELVVENDSGPAVSSASPAQQPLTSGVSSPPHPSQDVGAWSLAEREPSRAQVTIAADNGEMTPTRLLALAVQSGASIDQLERLMKLKQDADRMRVEEEAREAEKAYNVAFARFRAESVRVTRDKDRTSGPLQGQKYAQLSTFTVAATPALSKHGLSASWQITKDQPDWIEVTCTLKHELGHRETAAMGGPPDVGPGRNALQARASTAKYLERYTFQAICGLAEEDDDDDGNGGEQGRMDEGVVADHLAAMDEAPNVGTLKTAYMTAIKAADAVKDKRAAAKFTDARDKKLKAVRK